MVSENLKAGQAVLHSAIPFEQKLVADPDRLGYCISVPPVTFMGRLYIPTFYMVKRIVDIGISGASSFQCCRK
jgi:hypothetical protein